MGVSTYLSSIARRRRWARKPVSFWQKNMIAAIVIPLQVLARMSKLLEKVIKCEKFYHFAMGEGLTSFGINNRTNFFGEHAQKL